MSELKLTNDINNDSTITVTGPIMCPGHSRPIPDIQFSDITDDHEYYLISSCLDSQAMLREGDSGDWIGTFIGHKGAVWCARLNENADRALTSSADYTIKFWDAIDGNMLHSWEHEHVMKACSFTKDEKQCLSGGFNKVLSIHDLENYEKEPITAKVEEQLNHICKTSDDNLFLSSGKGKNIQLWDKRQMEIVRELSTSNTVTSISLTHDATSIVSASGQQVHIWDAKDFSLKKTHECPIPLSCAAYEPQCGKILTGSLNELWVRVYDFESGEEIACKKGHHGPVHTISVAPTFLSYASGSEDGTIRIWSFDSS